MAQEISRFFDYMDDDKEYQADEFAEFFRTFLTDGVPELGTNLQITAPGTGMTVNAGYGAAIVQGYGYWLKDDGTGIKSLNIAAAPSSNTRIDRVVLRLDKSVATRSIMLAVLTGTPAASPFPPALTREGNIYELSLARVTVGPGVLSIAPAAVTDERPDNSVCGLVEPRRIRDSIDQPVKVTSSPTFAGVTVTGTVTANKVIGAVYQ